MIRYDMSVVSLRTKGKMFIASSAHSMVGLIVMTRSSAAPRGENDCFSSFMGPIREPVGHPALERRVRIPGRNASVVRKTGRK